MKLLKKRGYEGSIRRVYNDDRTVVYGLIGTVGDLLKESIFASCELDPDVWVYVPKDSTGVFFIDTRIELIDYLKEVLG